jgi:hypothetical protein
LTSASASLPFVKIIEDHCPIDYQKNRALLTEVHQKIDFKFKYVQVNYKSKNA